MKVLLFGKRGQVGSEFTKVFATRSSIQLTAFSSSDLDLSDVSGIEQAIKKLAPDWVVNAAAYTAVDQAETDRETASDINTRAPIAMAKACKACGAKFIHFSTDYVFDGYKDEAYVESDETNPQSIYGQTKLDGELGVMAEMHKAIILRTAWVYDKRGKNFVNTMIRLAQKMPKLRVVNDQFGSPTYVPDLVEATINIMDKVASKEANGGIYHLTGQGSTSWFGFCEEIMRLKDWQHIEIEAVPTSSFPTPARRPANSVLSNEKVKQVFHQSMPHWRDALNRCLSN